MNDLEGKTKEIANMVGLFAKEVAPVLNHDYGMLACVVQDFARTITHYVLYGPPELPRQGPTDSEG